MRIAIVSAGQVTNIIDADSVASAPTAPDETAVADDGTAWIGGAWDGQDFEPRPAIVRPSRSEKDEAEVEARFTPGSVERALAVIIFELANTVRSLEGKPALTVNQFKTYLKGKIR